MLLASLCSSHFIVKITWHVCLSLFTWNFEPCQQKAHYEVVMKKKVLAVIENAESEYADLQHLCQVFFCHNSYLWDPMKW
jgi:hypothetical protein